MNNPTLRAVAAGIAAALVVLIAGWQAGEGISTGEWLTAALAFLAGSGLVTVVQTKKAVDEQMDMVDMTALHVEDLARTVEKNVDQLKRVAAGQLEADKHNLQVAKDNTDLTRRISELERNVSDVSRSVSDVQEGVRVLENPPEANRRE